MRRIIERIMDPRVAPYLCAALLFGGLVVDLNSDQALVVAIIYNIPIALAAVLLSKRLTVAFVALAMLANVAAGFDNARTMGSFDGITILNRVLAASTFLIVGVLSLLFEQTHEEVEQLHDVEDLVERERDIRKFLTALSGPLTSVELRDRAAVGLRELLAAQAVVVTAIGDDDRFAEPRVAVPAYSTVASAGKLASWAVDALPVTATPVITVRGDTGIISVGRWRSARGADLIVVADRPGRRKASELLGQALEGLEPLRERALASEGVGVRPSGPTSLQPDPTG